MTNSSTSIITVQQHIMREQKRFPGASGEFSFLLSGITLATKMIQAQVRRAGLTDVLGEHGDMNVQGEIQQKLDVISNEALVHCLSARESIGVLASEENENPMLVHQGSKEAKYAVVFDPLDGSSNIDVNVSVGTTFSILRKPDDVSGDNPEAWVLQPGSKQIAAGYVVYGSSTILVYSAGHGVHGAHVNDLENVRVWFDGFAKSDVALHDETFQRRREVDTRWRVSRLATLQTTDTLPCSDDITFVCEQFGDSARYPTADYTFVGVNGGQAT